MNEAQLRHLLACHVCKQSLTFNGTSAFCRGCNLRVKQIDGIWHCLGKLSPSTQIAKKQYNFLFTKVFDGPTDGSYEILASFARGNRSVDISCGMGIIERLSPQTVGVDFSLTALKKAKKNGARYLILADAHALPFSDDAFEVAISAGNLEHYENQQLAISEMARISRIQIFIVHRYPPIPFAKIFYQIVSKLFHVQHQPIERPLSLKQLEQMFAYVRLHVVFRGVWTLPLNYGRVIKWLPQLKIFPSAWFIISVKK